MSEKRRVHPVLYHFPTILAYVIAIGLGAYFLINELTKDRPPDSTISEFGARYLAKSAYSNMDHTVGLAVCNADGYRKDDDTWEIECILNREDTVETTRWEVAPNGAAELIDMQVEELDILPDDDEVRSGRGAAPPALAAA